MSSFRAKGLNYITTPSIYAHSNSLFAIKHHHTLYSLKYGQASLNEAQINTLSALTNSKGYARYFTKILAAFRM